MKFASRNEAGVRLGEFLRVRGVAADVVLGLLRGGMVVAAEVARELKLPLDILPVRKIGHPLQRELAVGALAEPDVFMLDELMLAEIPAARADLDRVIAEERAHLWEYRARFQPAAVPDLQGRRVVLVDDGLATGATAAAGVLSAWRQGAGHVMVAVPVASTSGVERVKRESAEVVSLVVDPEFGSVGQYYEHFAQTTDAEVLALLGRWSSSETGGC